MALKQKVRLELEDGTTVETVYDGRDIRGWEGRYGKGAIGVATTLSMLTYYAWSAAKRDGSLNGEYDKYEAFDKVCTWVEFAKDPETETEADPEAPPDPPDPEPEPEPSPDTPKAASGG